MYLKWNKKIAGDRIKHVGCSIWLKTLPINIQLQNLKTWLPLKFIFNLRPRPYTIELKQPLYWAMSTPLFFMTAGKRWSFGFCRPTQWPLSPNSFRILFWILNHWIVSSWWADTVHILLTETHSFIHNTQFLSCPYHTLLTIVLTYKHKISYWACL